METTFLKTLTEEQNNELAAMSVELRVLANKLSAFRLKHGDNHGCVSEAAGFASASYQSVEELISRCAFQARVTPRKPSGRRFGR